MKATTCRSCSHPTCRIRGSFRLVSVYSIACASPAYIEKHGAPHVLSDLVRHTCLHLMTPVFPPDLGLRRPERSGDGEPRPVDLHGECRRGDGRSDPREHGHRRAADIVRAAGPARGHAGARAAAIHDAGAERVRALSVAPDLDAKIRTWVEFLREALPDTLAADAESLKEFRDLRRGATQARERSVTK